MEPAAGLAPPQTSLADAAAVVAGARDVLWLAADGEVDEVGFAEAARRVQRAPALVCHAGALARRLRCPRFVAFDLLELFAFVRPARFCLPTPAGLAEALGLKAPADRSEAALLLRRAADVLLTELREGEPDQRRAVRIALTMARGGWPWGPAVVQAIGVPEGAGSGLDVWASLPVWEEGPPPGPPDDRSVEPEEARRWLAALLGPEAEARPQQAEYAAGVCPAFAPRHDAGAPRLVLAEAGTGVGKTVGYMAPAGLWARRNKGTVWLSTYTRNLQRQLDGELDRLYPDARIKRRKAVVRKGRENYLCLLNFEDAARRGGAPVALGLMARWAAATRDGDMVGGDFPSWLIDLLGAGRTRGLSDHRGECIYSACPHYRKCFIERVGRKAREAEIVVANHALVMVRAALGDDPYLPTRYVFDEGHHLFDAADSAFSAFLSGVEGAEVRRWLIGAEGRRSRARGLEARIADLMPDTEGAEALLAEVQRASRALPSEGWLRRLLDGTPLGPAEAFLGQVRRHVLARSADSDSAYDLEAPVSEPAPALLEAAASLAQALDALQGPLTRLSRLLAKRLDEEADELDSTTRVRLEGAVRGLRRRAELVVGAWRRMLHDLPLGAPPEFVDWFALARIDGRDADVGLRRHWVDPTIPFTEQVLARAHGVLVTSATLRDRTDEAPDAWDAAEVRTGALHLAQPAVRFEVDSPFDYAADTRVFIVTDVRRTDTAQVAAAYRELFLAAGGGALGLFTAIRRLRAVHERIAGPLEQAGINLLAQHVDGMDAGTLVDIFRAEEDSCLLGTDAMRDGVDVPGRALRLIVFDRLPWPRPDLLHKARRAAFGGRRYDDLIARLRLKQAYGRLLRSRHDHGVFVLLEAATPSRLLTAFPPGVEPRRLGLAEAVRETARFLSERPAG